MADAGGLHRTKRADNYSLGDYNRVTFVNSSTTFHATGSHAGAGFIVENATNVVITLPDGSTIPGSTLKYPSRMSRCPRARPPNCGHSPEAGFSKRMQSFRFPVTPSRQIVEIRC